MVIVVITVVIVIITIVIVIITEVFLVITAVFTIVITRASQNFRCQTILPHREKRL